MASLFSKLTQFAKSPQGQRAIRTAGDKAQQFAKDPKNRARIEQVRSKLQGGKGGGAAR